VNLLKTKLGRTSAVIAGSIIGLAGVAVFASPASAHAPIVSGDTSCIKDGAKTYDVTWHIGNDYQHTTQDGREVTGAVDSIKFYKVTDEHLSDPLGTAEVSLDGAAPGTDVPFSGQDEGKLVATSKVSTDLDKVKIAVILKWSDGYINDGKNGHGDPVTASVDKPDYCTPPTTPTTPPTTPPTTTPPTESAPTIPAPTASFDCTTETINFDNSKGSVPVTLELKTTKGEVRTVKVGAGDKAKPEVFSGKAGFSVHATTEWTDTNGKPKSDFADFDYKQPAGCDNGEGGGLPVTGAAAGGIAGGAAVLLVAGGVLFMMARRRKVKFTA
jgi:hypothetical protein